MKTSFGIKLEVGQIWQEKNVGISSLKIVDIVPGDKVFYSWTESPEHRSSISYESLCDSLSQYFVLIGNSQPVDPDLLWE